MMITTTNTEPSITINGVALPASNLLNAIRDAYEQAGLSAIISAQIISDYADQKIAVDNKLYLSKCTLRQVLSAAVGYCDALISKTAEDDRALVYTVLLSLLWDNTTQTD